jgi:anaphase-promoting complex subunit 4
LAKYHNSSQVLDVPVKDFSDLLDIIRCLTLLGHTLLSYAAEDKRQFAVFSTWLRFEMGNQRSDSNEEVSVDSEIGSAYPDLLAYLQGPMTGSRLKPYLTAPSTEKTSETADDTLLTYDNVRKAINQQKRSEEFDPTVLHTVTLSLHLQQLARNLFGKITAWQVSNSSMNCGLVLESSKTTTVDARMFPAEDATDEFEEDMVSYVASVSTERVNQLHLHRIQHTPVFADIDTSVRSYDAVTINFGQCTIRDVKMADDKTLIAIMEASGNLHSLLTCSGFIANWDQMNHIFFDYPTRRRTRPKSKFHMILSPPLEPPGRLRHSVFPMGTGTPLTACGI